MPTRPDMWQEYDCPVQLTDMDLAMDEILIVGEVFPCCICGGEHTATETFPPGTTLKLDDGKEQYRGVPKDAAEKEAWLAEVNAALMRFTPNCAAARPPRMPC